MNASSQRTVLVVEDDAKIAGLLTDYLAQAGYAHRWVSNGRAAVTEMRERPADLILLDVLLPGMDGMAVCRAVRQFSSVPVIMVTARIEEVDRLLGLELGSDDYICKPFSPREVMGRIQAIFRRIDWLQLAGTVSDALHLDEARMAARVRGQALDLTPAEFRLLQTLTERPGRILSRDQLVRKMHPDERDIGDRAVDSHIKNLRKKIAQAAPDADPIRSVYGVGYKWEWEPDGG